MIKLKIGKKEIILTGNKSIKLNDVNELLFIHSIKNVVTHMLSLAIPSEEEQEVLNKYEELCSVEGMEENPFSEEEEEKIVNNFFDLKSRGISNGYLKDIGGIYLEIETGVYKFLYTFDGIDFGEIIRKNDKVIVNNVYPELFIVGFNEPLVDINVNEIISSGPLESLWNNENSESTFCSAAVLCFEYKEFKSVDKVWKKILKPAYVELSNELKKIITELFIEDGESKLLADVPEEMVNDLKVLIDKSGMYDSTIVYTGQ